MQISWSVKRLYDDLLTASSARMLRASPGGNAAIMREVKRLMSDFLERAEITLHRHTEESPEAIEIFQNVVEPMGEGACSSAAQWLQANTLNPVWNETARIRFQAISLYHWLEKY